MSTFNSNEFNNILFGEINTDVPPPFRVVYLSASISGSSSVSVINQNAVYIIPDIIEGSSEVSVEANRNVGVSADITGFSEVTPNIGAIYGVSSHISSGSYFITGNFLRARIDTESILTAEAVVRFNLNALILGDSVVTANTLTGDYHLEADITGSSDVSAGLKWFGSLPPEQILGESTVTASTLFLFKRLEGAVVEGSSTVTANMSKVVYLTARIDGGSSVNARASYIASLSANIQGSSNLLKLINVSADEILGNTIVTANLTTPQKFINSRNRRRVTFVFEVDKPRTNVSIIDNHYKLFSFYNSLANVNQTLNYVRRTAGQELKNYKVDNSTHRAWNSDADLATLKPGDRGIVKKGATGMFAGRDGYFALYKGPIVVDDEPEETE